MDISSWLRDLGLGEYERAFVENEVDASLLPTLTAEDLKDLGVKLVGHRRKLLNAIQALDREDASTVSRESGASDTDPRIAFPQPATAQEQGAERRQLTVAFIDLVGSTSLSRQLDPEEMRDIIQLYQNTVAGEVTRYDGHIAKYMGDGVLAYFGWPRAQEDAAERAVRSCLAVAREVSALKMQHGQALATRVGIATGLVVVGDLIGEGAAQEAVVVGETPNLAARLQGLAEPNCVVISGSTSRLLGQLFDLVRLGEQKLKGFSEPVEAFQVAGESTAEGRFEALHAARMTAFVGREQETGLLLDRWRRAKGGEGQVVQLIGEPGIGKSRIVRDVCVKLERDPHTRLRYYCSPYHSNSAFYPFIDQLSRAADILREEHSDHKLDKVEALLARACEDISSAAPLVAALLSIPFNDRYPPLELTPQRQKTRIFEALLAQLTGLASQHTVLMVVEDVQWIDPTSLELFNLAVDCIEGLPVLMVATSRPEPSPPWSSHPSTTTLTLNRLGRSQATEIISETAGGRQLPPEVLEQILAKTDGVPLFVEELTRVVLESGLLRVEEGRLLLSGPLPALAIPTTLQDSLMARLDRLAAVKEVAQIGAVIGREFPYVLLAAVAGMSEADLDSALIKLTDSELIFRRGTPPDVTYSFRHGLVQDAAYESLLRSKRQVLHARIAPALEELFPDVVETQPESLARHCSEAGLIEKAVELWKRAGQVAMGRNATTEAIAHLQSGLSALLTLPEDKERHRQELGIQLAMGSALVAAHGFAAPDTGNAYMRARELCEMLGDLKQLFPVLYGICLFHLYGGRLDAAEGASNLLLDHACDSSDRDMHFFARRAAGVCAYPAGKLVEARKHLEEALDLYDSKRHRTPAFVYAFDPRVVCLDYLARTLFLLGCVDKAFETNEEAVAEARRTGHRNSLALPLFFGGKLHQQCNNHAEVQERAEELINLAEEEGFRFWLAGGRFLEGWVTAETGDREVGVRQMREAIGEWQRTGADYMMPYFLTVVARASIRDGDGGNARDLLNAAAEQISRSGERWFEAEVYRTMGEAFVCSPQHEENHAITYFEKALEIARLQHARLWQLRALLNLCQLSGSAHSIEVRRSSLSELCADLAKEKSIPDLLKARAILSEGGA